MRTIRALVVIMCCGAAQGCATLTSLLLPTPVPCAPKDSPSPPKITADSLLAKLDNYHLILVIGAERNDLIVYAGQADAIIQACK